MPGAIVIGAGPGIGTSVARRFAREGLAVGVLARSPATVEAALAALAGLGTDTVGVSADVTDEPALRAALDEVVDRARGSRGPRLQRGADPVGRARRARGAAAPRRVGGQRRGRDHRRRAPRARDGPDGPRHDPAHRRHARAGARRDQPVAGQGRRPRARAAGRAGVRALRRPRRDRHRRRRRGAGVRRSTPTRSPSSTGGCTPSRAGAWEREVLYSGPVTPRAALPR